MTRCTVGRRRPTWTSAIAAFPHPVGVGRVGIHRPGKIAGPQPPARRPARPRPPAGPRQNRRARSPRSRPARASRPRRSQPRSAWTWVPYRAAPRVSAAACAADHQQIPCLLIGRGQVPGLTGLPYGQRRGAGGDVDVAAPDDLMRRVFRGREQPIPRRAVRVGASGKAGQPGLGHNTSPSSGRHPHVHHRVPALGPQPARHPYRAFCRA